MLAYGICFSLSDLLHFYYPCNLIVSVLHTSQETHNTSKKSPRSIPVSLICPLPGSLWHSLSTPLLLGHTLLCCLAVSSAHCPSLCTECEFQKVREHASCWLELIAGTTGLQALDKGRKGRKERKKRLLKWDQLD